MNTDLLWPLAQNFFVASGQAAALIAIIVLVTPLAARFVPARWRMALWALIMIRLLVPMLPHSHFSAYGWMTTSTPQRMSVQQHSAVAAEPIVESTFAPASAPRAFAPIRADHLAAAAAVSTAQITPAGTTTLPWLELALICWSLGAIAVGVVHLRDRSRLSRLLRSSSPCTSPRVLVLLKACQEHVRLERRIPIRTTDVVPSPALVGWRQPCVLLPSAVDAMSDNDIRHALLHELTHIKRHDMFIDRCMVLATAIHWFNPLVWVMARRLRADQELACDESVVSRLSTHERTDYAKTIISLCEQISHARAARPLLAMSADKHLIKRRIIMITRFQAHGIARKTLSLLIMSAAALVFLTRPGATPAAEADDSNANPAATPLEKSPIDVTPPEEVSESERQLRIRLEKPVTCNYHDRDLVDAIADLSKLTDLNIVLDQQILNDGASPITLQVENMKVRHCLDYICRLSELSYIHDDNMIIIGHASDYITLETRFFDLQPLLVGITTENSSEQVAKLSILLHDYISIKVLDDFFPITCKGTLLISRNTSRCNDLILRFLEQLRDRKQFIDPDTIESDALLAAKVTVDFNSTPLNDAVTAVSQQLHFPVVWAERFAEAASNFSVTMQARDVPLSRILSLMLQPQGWQYEAKDKAIYISLPHTEADFEIYDFAQLPISDDQLLVVIKGAVPEFANEEGLHSLACWNKLLIAYGPKEDQRNLKKILADLRRFGSGLAAMHAYPEYISTDKKSPNNFIEAPTDDKSPDQFIEMPKKAHP
jgi:beta-lactamase regulating signal transducer with metallopeptidase domain